MMNCSGASDYTMVIKGTVALGEEVTVTMNGSNVTATRVDPVVSSANATINNATTASIFNAEQICGFSDWDVGTPKDILETDCSPDISKGIIYIDDTGDPDVWYNGDEEGPVDVQGYPAVIDLNSAQERT
jgi:hypothetical protein